VEVAAVLAAEGVSARTIAQWSQVLYQQTLQSAGRRRALVSTARTASWATHRVGAGIGLGDEDTVVDAPAGGGSDVGALSGLSAGSSETTWRTQGRIEGVGRSSDWRWRF
jgi:hypothetical protein